LQESGLTRIKVQVQRFVHGENGIFWDLTSMENAGKISDEEYLQLYLDNE